MKKVNPPEVTYKVYCIKCKHSGRGGYKSLVCWHPTNIESSAISNNDGFRQSVYDINRLNNCSHFEKASRLKLFLMWLLY